MPPYLHSITCSQVRPPSHTHTLSWPLSESHFSLRAFTALTREPLPHRLMSLCRDLSCACIGMFESLLLHPYCADDLGTSVHHPDMGHHLCYRNWFTILEFRLSSFLTPKNNENIVKCSCFLSCSLKYRKGASTSSHLPPFADHVDHQLKRTSLAYSS